MAKLTIKGQPVSSSFNNSENIKFSSSNLTSGNVSDAIKELKTEIDEIELTPGPKGDSVTVTKVEESSADSGSNVVTFSDGKTLTVKNGSKGSKGDTGPRGPQGNVGATGPRGPAGSTSYTAKEVYNGDNDAWVSSPWNSHLGASSKNIRFSIQSDGNAVVYKNNSSLWQTGTSSRRFKHNIKDITEERAKELLNIRVRTFDYNDDQICSTGLTDKVGVIAEEVTNVMKDVVIFEPSDDDPSKMIERSVDYQGFVPYLIKMIQIQQKEIDNLKAKIEKLEK